MNKNNIFTVLNYARVEAGYEDRIPEINQSNLHELSLLPPEDINAFINVIGKIVRQHIFDTVYDRSENPFADFFQEKLEAGENVEDLYVDLITGDTPAWNDDGSYALSKKAPNVTAIYHKKNFEMQYKVSTSYAQSKSAFLTPAGVDSLTNRILGTLNSSCEYDLYLQCLELLSTMYNKGVFKRQYGYSLANESGIKGFLKDLKKTVKDFKFMNTKYNPLGLNTKTNPDNIIIITKPKYLAEIDVEFLAGVFNLEKTALDGRIIEVPDDYGFGTYDTADNPIYALVLDKRALRIFPTLFEGGSIYNPANLCTNTFLTDCFVFSYATFMNAVAFVGGTAPADVEPKVEVDGTYCKSASADKEAYTVGETVTVTPVYDTGAGFKSAKLVYVDKMTGETVTADLEETASNTVVFSAPNTDTFTVTVTGETTATANSKAGK